MSEKNENLVERYHEHTKEFKLKWFGRGEWVEEPDRVIFYHKGIRCRVARTALGTFAGHLCGYCALPLGHPWVGKEADDIDADIHGGITCSGITDEGDYVIGFDCAHFADLIPSSEQLMFRLKTLKSEFSANFLESLDTLTPAFAQKKYRNLDFVMEQCRLLADQVNAVSLGCTSEGEV